MADETSTLAVIEMRNELTKIGAVREIARKFVEGAGPEFGPAVGAVLGAGAANIYGVSPLSGAAVGGALGAAPHIIKGLRARAAAGGH